MIFNELEVPMSKVGRKSGISYEDVARVAVELTVAGQNPSIRAIRNELGTGSESTIGAHLRKWRAFETSKKQEDMEAGLSKELLSAIHAEITKHTNDTKTAMSENLNQANESIKELEGLLEKSEQKQNELLVTIQEKEAAIANLKAEAEVQSKSFTQLRSEAHNLGLKAQKERDFAIEMKTQNEFMTKINDKLEKQLEDERKKRHELELKLASDASNKKK